MDHTTHLENGQAAITPDPGWGRRTFKVAAAAGSVAAAFLLVWYGMHVLLLVFAGALLALLLSGLSDLLSRHTPLSYRPAFAVVVIGIALLLGLTFWVSWTRIADQADELSRQLPQAVRELTEPLERYSWFRNLRDGETSLRQVLPNRGEIVSRATGILSSAFGVLTSVAVVLFIAIYAAFDPSLYRSGLVRLVPPPRRRRANEVLDQLRHALQWWLIAHFSAMAVVGILTGIGLTLLGVPLAFILAVIAALLTFIPNIGPVLSAIPAILIGLSQKPALALYVALLYIGVQAVESNLITPVFELKAVSLPPALTISVQLLLGTLVGVLGLLVASPLCASAMVLVRTLYLEDARNESTAEG